MEDSRESITDIITAWKAKYGQKALGQGGTPYIRMPKESKFEDLRALAETMFEAGYTFDEIDNPHVSVEIAKACWQEKRITRMSKSEVRDAQEGLADDWNLVIAEFSSIKVSERSEIKKAAPFVPKKEVKVEKPIEIEPKDRIKVDTTGFADTPLDLNFLAKLGVDPSSEDE